MYTSSGSGWIGFGHLSPLAFSSVPFWTTSEKATRVMPDFLAIHSSSSEKLSNTIRLFSDLRASFQFSSFHSSTFFICSLPTHIVAMPVSLTMLSRLSFLVYCQQATLVTLWNMPATWTSHHSGRDSDHKPMNFHFRWLSSWTSTTGARTMARMPRLMASALVIALRQESH